MAGETVITVVGNRRPTPNCVSRRPVPRSPTSRWRRRRAPSTVRPTNGRDGEALFLRCNIWREAAENVTESLVKGTRVIVSGRLKQRSFETREGEKRTVYELDVDEIGPSLRYATAKVTRALRAVAAVAASVRAAAAVRRRNQPVANEDPWGSAPRRFRRCRRRTTFLDLSGVIHGKTKGRKPASKRSSRPRRAASARTRARSSTTRTPRFCVGSCRTAARFGRVG